MKKEIDRLNFVMAGVSILTGIVKFGADEYDRRWANGDFQQFYEPSSEDATKLLELAQEIAPKISLDGYQNLDPRPDTKIFAQILLNMAFVDGSWGRVDKVTHAVKTVGLRISAGKLWGAEGALAIKRNESGQEIYRLEILVGDKSTDQEVFYWAAAYRIIQFVRDPYSYNEGTSGNILNAYLDSIWFPFSIGSIVFSTACPNLSTRRDALRALKFGLFGAASAYSSTRLVGAFAGDPLERQISLQLSEGIEGNLISSPALQALKGKLLIVRQPSNSDIA